VLTGLLVSAPSGFHTVAWFTGPALSPDGKQFAVTTDAASGTSDLELFDARTGKRASLLSEGSNLADPAWSPDGKMIAVTSYTLGEPRVLLVPSDGRAAAPLAIKGTTGESYRPSYSPDGVWITYTLRHDGRNDVHAVVVKTGQDVALTADGKSWNSVFSPDGRQIAFLRESGGLIDLYAMDVAEALLGGPLHAAVKLTPARASTATADRPGVGDLDQALADLRRHEVHRGDDDHDHEDDQAGRAVLRQVDRLEQVEADAAATDETEDRREAERWYRVGRS